MSYFKNNYNENITLTSLSKAMMLSPSEINKLFRLYLHESPMHYLIDYRLDKAADALKTTDQSVEEIAFSCGYSSPSFFIRSFKRKYQKTPFAYRQSK
jgi:transcriptional regulator GlxA family with amidase domain